MRDDGASPALPGTNPQAALATATPDHARTMAELVACGSIECSKGTADEIRRAAELLPRQMPVFVPALPGRTLETGLELLGCILEAGFDPVPHLAARQIPSRAALKEFLARVHRDAGVRRVLVIGGDSRTPAGPYADAMAVLRDEVLSANGIAEVGFAGYPEGHRHLPADCLREALVDKLALAAEEGLGTFVVTQFSFLPTRILEYCGWLNSVTPDTPVVVGLAGPASLRQLVHFARYCGVAASLSAVARIGVRIPQLTSHMQADEQLALIAGSVDAHAHGRCNITGVHVFSFGGFAATAAWMHDRINLR